MQEDSLSQHLHPIWTFMLLSLNQFIRPKLEHNDLASGGYLHREIALLCKVYS